MGTRLSDIIVSPSMHPCKRGSGELCTSGMFQWKAHSVNIHEPGRVSSSNKIWGGSAINEWAYLAYQVFLGRMFSPPDCLGYII